MNYQATHAWPLGPLVKAISNLANMAMVPFAIMASMVSPPHNHHFSAAHELIKVTLAAGGYTLAVAAARWLRGLLELFREKPPEPERRSLLKVAVLTPLALTAAYPIVIEPLLLKVRRYELALPNLPAELDGLKLGHFSDSHYGPLVDAGHIRRAIALLNAEEPDVVLMTGDYVHHTPLSIPTGIALLGGLKGRIGQVAVLGNHDHWEGVEAVRAELSRLPIRMLDNDRLFLTREGLHDEPRPGAVALCGVGDLWEDVVDPRRATRDVPEGCPRLLLSHNPDVAETLTVPFDLQFSGHTHGGQCSFPGIGTPMVPSRYGPKYAGGVVQGPGWPVVVSRGVGMAVMPVRFRVPPEVVVVTLRRA